MYSRMLACRVAEHVVILWTVDGVLDLPHDVVEAGELRVPRAEPPQVLIDRSRHPQSTVPRSYSIHYHLSTAGLNGRLCGVIWAADKG